ncbi:uncharacterized protein MONOS_691 [Monocercomonoides exilis]|uniref:uncharacterized protein n=1 Tax=Monocercomonoides exilis TaxID=2049356 RepID=UPI00355A7D84|nr:hypothetical protein MONOS_691 [Monocercomonoides exilis]|eukprot:MONOS_691.1-p1 / transcript=MONOS_691.1 / gene=MONOS_691 / organism=Monocercomonoides_exilis_PA203 / gene_product=unspecified product / transcript_product=unspecified product / location=Mono_scaffold00011:200168-206008(-) / protein_length=1910 / sequence_SO=supercontig / SO=protein_coding / is_pseudo=false
MIKEDNKSMSSITSGVSVGYAQSEGLSKIETVGFSVFSPLYDQPKHPNMKWEIFIWSITMLQMVTISFFRIDILTQDVNKISQYLCYLDGTYLGYLVGKSVSVVIMGFMCYFILLVVYLLAVAVFQGSISGSQPWIISLLRWIVRVTYTILFIPLISFCITSFDCYESGGQMIQHGFESICFNDSMSISGFVISVVILAYILLSSFFVNNMIYNHNPKYGGLWSSPCGLWQALDSSLVYGCVFAMRMLYGWPFWRGVVTVGSSLVLTMYFVYIQPIYKLNGNLLMACKWCMFGCLRLFGEVGYAIEGAAHNWIVTVVLQVVGVISGIVMCIVLLPRIGRKSREKKYLLTAFGNQLSDICSESSSLALPPLKKPDRIEPSLRFIQKKEYRTMIYLTFADYVYTQALKTNKSNCMLYFQYATFLASYRKNYVKANTLLRKARTLSPNLFLNFVLFCKAKENGGRVNGDSGGNGTSDMNSFAFTSLLAKAEKHHELAVSAMKDFFENATAIQPDYKSIPVLLNSIVKNEDIARKSYEELIASHGQNTAVLRSYARLLLDIYDDEDEAEMILNRADRIEEESTSSGDSLTHTQATTSADALLAVGETDDAGDRKPGGNVKTSARGEDSTESEANYVRTVRCGSLEVTAGSVYENPDSGKGAEGGAIASPSSSDLQNLDGEQDALARSEMQWQHSSNDDRRHQKYNKKKRKKKKKKKKDAMIVDLMMGGRGESGSQANNISLLRFTVICLHLVDVTALIIALVVYVVMSNIYQKDLDTLRNVCDLSYHTARSAAISYNFFVYDIKYKFVNQTIVDEWMSTMVRKTELLKMLKETSESLASMLGRVHESTTNMEPWETASIDTYSFIFTTKNETQSDGSVEEVVDIKQQVLHPSSMLEVIATVSQMIYHLSISDMAARPENPDYLPNIQYLVFNCPVPILDGAKRVIMSYFDIINSGCNEIITVVVLIITICLAPLTAIQLILFVRVTRAAVKNRIMAFHAMLDVPKNKMQGVIRRLLRDEDNDDDFSMSAALNENQDAKAPDSCSSDKYERWEDGEAQFMDEGTDESSPSPHPKKSTRTPRSGKCIEEKLTDNSTSSSSTRRASKELSHRKTPLAFNSSALELDSEESNSPLLAGPEPSVVSISEALLSLPSPKLLFGEQIMSTSSTPGFHFQSPRIDEENMRVAQISEQNSGSGKSARTSPLDDLFSVKQKHETEVAASEIQSYRSRNDGSTADHVVFKTSEIESVTQDAANHKRASEDSGTVGTTGITPAQTGSSLKTQQSPSFGGNVNSAMQSNKQLTNNQGIDLTNVAQSPSLLSKLFPGNGSQLYSGIVPSYSVYSQQSISECGTNPVFSPARVISPAASSNLYRKSFSLPNSQNTHVSQFEKQYAAPKVNKLSNIMQKVSDDSEPLVHNQQIQNKISDTKFQFDDEDSEESEKYKQMGFVRNAVDDTAWEEGMEKEIEKLEAAYKQLPSPVTGVIIVTSVLSVLLGVATIASTVVLVIFYVESFKPTSANIILSGMRASILFQIQYLLSTILQPIPILKTDQSITFPSSRNPILYNSSHCSGSPAVARDLLVPMSRYFEAVHLDCHFGDSDYTQTDDFTYDTVSVTRMKTAINHQMLLKEAQCYLADSDDCSQADEYRMYGVKGTIYGLTTLLARLRVNLERISKMDVSEVTIMNTEARFVMTALRSDIVQGLNKMTNMILATGKEEVQESITILIVVIVCFCLLFIISMFGNGLTWIEEIKFIENVSEKLFNLLPMKEGEKEIEMLPSMVTGHASFDKGRESILDAAQQLLASVKRNEHIETIMATFFQLSSTVLAVFTEEEKEMAAKNYVGIEKHKKEHILIRQRLTLIGDQLCSKNDAVKAVGRRKVISLFDMHFTDEDITCAEAVYGLNVGEQKIDEEENNINL